ncbi:MAG: ATP-dependent dethiobiotin synthetase BioD [Lysobacteraceae bacterium]|nr:MAG: ATP-dependent dethiobiotin synthetase BioD [Xanthomonadaceae bacterium]
MRLFVTGTDTGIGKTWVSQSLVHLLRQQGRKVAVMKPVASGCEQTADGLRNEDAVALIEACGQGLSYDLVNPYAFEPAIAPHLAAAAAGRSVDLQQVQQACAALESACDAEVTLIEGAGGWCVPLGEELMFADMARALQAEVILVVGMRLGCLNHAMLTADRIISDGFKLRGWVANAIDPAMDVAEENQRWLEEKMPVPCLGRVGHGQCPAEAAGHLVLNV